MTESSNMICPACGEFQPRADICNKCGVIIAKATAATQDNAPVNQEAPSSGLLGKIAVIALIAVPVIGYFVFTGVDTSETAKTYSSLNTAKPGDKSEIDRIGTFNSDVADNLRLSSVISKLNTLRTRLNIYLAEGNEPPANDEGLQYLVDKGILGQADITDDWGHIFSYRLDQGKDVPGGKEYKIYIYSNGPDGIAGNADDISL